MTTPTPPDELAAVLAAHQAWLDDPDTGARAYLSYANLRGAYLSYADLSYADLSYADLRDANLRDANLSYANLIDAGLRDANLRDANLIGSYLSGADLRHADLVGANLSGADLRGADLERTSLPDGVGWWQGGYYGPRRRMVRALRSPDMTVTVMLGCITGTPDEALKELAARRIVVWATGIGMEAAQREYARAAGLVEFAVSTLLEDGEAD